MIRKINKLLSTILNIIEKLGEVLIERRNGKTGL